MPPLISQAIQPPPLCLPFLHNCVIILLSPSKIPYKGGVVVTKDEIALKIFELTWSNAEYRSDNINTSVYEDYAQIHADYYNKIYAALKLDD